MYQCEEPILEPVDHKMQQHPSDVWGKFKTTKRTAPRPHTHPMPQEEVDSLCDSFAQRCSSKNLPERTNNLQTNMVPECVRTITTASYKAVDTVQEFIISELENVQHRLKATALGDVTVCNSIIKNAPLATRHLFL